MDMLTGEQIAKTDLTDWRKLGQGLHARYVVGDFGTGVRFVAAVGEAGDALGHHPRVTMGDRHVRPSCPTRHTARAHKTGIPLFVGLRRR